MNSNSDYKTELEKNGAIAFVPGGNSMWPTLKKSRSVGYCQEKKRTS